MLTILSVCLQVVGIVVVTIILLTLSGWPFTRWSAAMNPLERVALSALAGQLILGTVCGLAYVCHLPPGCEIAVMIASEGWGTGCVWSDARNRRLPHLSEQLCPLLAWAALATLILAGSALLTVHAVPGTAFDWWEHYRRAQFFLERIPPQTPIGDWSFAARAPLFNADAAICMRCLGVSSYWAYSAIATVLNAQAVLSVALLLTSYTTLTIRHALSIALLALLLIPGLNWNLTFTWTKLATAHWIVLAIYLLLTAADRSEAAMFGWSIIALTAGCLSHYFAIVYALLVAPWLIYLMTRKQLSRRPVVIASALAGLGLTAWMAFLIGTFGLHKVLTANSTFGSYGSQVTSRARSPHGPALVAINLATTLLPRAIRALPWFDHTSLEAFPDHVVYFFSPGQPVAPRSAGPDEVYQLSQVGGAIGYVGYCLIIAALCSAARRFRSWTGREWFFACMLFVGLPVNVMATSWFCPGGVLSHNLQPYLLLAIALVAGWLLRLSWNLRVALIAAVLIESIQHIASLYRSQLLAVTFTQLASGRLPLNGVSVDPDYITNLQIKVQNHITMLSDAVGEGAARCAAAVVLLFIGLSLALWLLLPTTPPVRPRRAGSAALVVRS